MDKAKVDAALAKEAKKASIRSDKSMYVNAVRKERAVALTKFKEVLGSQMNMGVPVDALPHLAKYLLTFAKEGAANVDEVLKLAKADLPDLTRENVIEALTFKREAKPKTQGQKNAALIRQEARSENTLEGLREQIASKNPQGPKTRTSSVIPGSQLEKNQIAINKARREIRAIIGSENEGLLLKGYDAVNSVMRGQTATGDVGALGRQARELIFVGLLENPKATAKVLGQAFKALVSDKAYEQAHNAQIHEPGFQTWVKAGGTHTERGSFTAREEGFIANLVEKIPGWGKVVKGSENFHTVILNGLREDAFYRWLDEWKAIEQKTGQKVSQEQLHHAAKAFDILTGRGDLGALGTHIKWLNRGIYAIRYKVAQVQYFDLLRRAKGDPVLTKKILKAYGTRVGWKVAVLTLAKLSGAKTTDNPDDSDWGKFVIGNNHYDIGAGGTAWERVAAKLIKATAQRLPEPVRNKMGIRPEKRKGMSQGVGELAGEMFIDRGQAPIPGLIGDWWRGTDVVGQPISKAKALGTRLVPFGATTALEAYQSGGAKEAAPAWIMESLGNNVTNYEKKKSSRRVR
jgi:hypothetical protein